MPAITLTPAELRLAIDPSSLGFSDTSQLLHESVPWIGQGRAEQAARFGLGMTEADYNLFVLGEVGSGRSSLLLRLMQEMAACKPVPPDLCYLYNFDAPERPLALRVAAGQGRVLRQMLAQLVKALQEEIPRRLAGTEFKSESERIQKAYKEHESRAYGELSAFAASRHFALHREGERLVFTMLDERGQAMLEDKVLAMPLERKAALEQAEQELRAEIARFFEKSRPREKAMNEALAELRRRTVSPLLEEQLQNIRAAMEQEGQDGTKLNGFFLQLSQDVLNHVELFEESDADEEGRLEELNKLLDLYVAVGISGASHHMAGCGSARNIVAINTDPEAAIFRDARFGVIGDFQKIVPALAAEVRKLMAERP